MGSKLKMKAPKKNRVLECDNQMSQAFGRAMKQSYKELQEMRDQAYNDGFDTGDNWATVVNTVTIMMALNKKHKFSTDRLLDVVHLANEYVKRRLKPWFHHIPGLFQHIPYLQRSSLSLHLG